MKSNDEILQELLHTQRGIQRIASAMRGPIEHCAERLSKVEMLLSDADKSNVGTHVTRLLLDGRMNIAALNELKDELGAMLVRDDRISAADAEAKELWDDIVDKKLGAEIVLARRDYKKNGGVPADDLIQKYK
jgi:hypothetical protein